MNIQDVDYAALREQLAASNPTEALDAVLASNNLTLGRIAVLERAQCPILIGNIENLTETLAALWLLEIPLDEAAKLWPERYTRSAVWADTLSQTEYRQKLSAALKALEDFRNMMPRPSDDQKKTSDSATVGSSNLPNGYAELTGGRFKRWFLKCLRFILLYFGVVTHKVAVDSNQEPYSPMK